jgi:glycosyltransferase involved in cell wall biosynthesis
MYHADLLGGIIARLVGIKRVYWGIRNTDPDHAQSKRITRFIARCCALISFIIPEKIICCSQKSASDHQNMGYKKNKFIIIPNGYEINVFKPNTDERLRLRAQWQHDPTTLLFGMVARYDPHKDHNNLFKALAQLRQVPHHHCILVGEGITPRNTELTDLIKKHGVQDRVSLLGPQNNIPAIMNALDVHVLSSVGEAFPNVLAEAMACGTPCVTTNVGDAALIVGETGWIVPPNDPESLAQALKFAIQCKQNSQKWQCRKLACRKRITENFGIDRMINKYDMAWANIMN